MNNETNSKIPRVFLVDDDKDTLAVLTHIFQKAQTVVVGTTQNTKAMELYEYETNISGVFDLVVLDIRMPTIDGNEIAKKIRQIGYKGLMIALTGNTSEGGKKISTDNGFDHYLNKQEIKSEVIKSIIQSSLNHYSNLQFIEHDK